MHGHDPPCHQLAKVFVLMGPTDIDCDLFPEFEDMSRVKEKASKTHVADGDINGDIVSSGESCLSRKGDSDVLPFIHHSRVL